VTCDAYELKLSRSPQAATTMFNLALLYQKMDFLPQAELLLNEALRIQVLKLGADHPSAEDTRLRLQQLHPPQLSDIGVQALQVASPQ